MQIGRGGYLGVGVEDAAGSVTVVEVESGSAAEFAGVVAGDTITGIGGTAVSSTTDLQSAIEDHEPGDRVVLAWTDTSGESHRAEVTLGEAPTN